MIKNIKDKIKSIGSGLLNIVFPPLCINCNQHDNRLLNGLVCQKCMDSVKINSALYCTKCGSRRVNTGTCHPQEGMLLGCATSYKDDLVRNLIHALKYQSNARALDPLEKIMTRSLKNLQANGISFSKDAIVVPVPLHRSKARARGFNQSKLIAETVTKFLGSDRLFKGAVEDEVLIKTRPTKRQVDMPGKQEREENIKGAFKVVDPEKINNEFVLLVDDVFTSGATMREAARTLKKAGAKQVVGLVVAKA